MPDAGHYAAGAALAVLCLALAGSGALALSRRLLPGLSGSSRAVADAILAIGLLTLALEAAGAIGLLSRGGVLAACAVAAALAHAAARRLPARTAPVAVPTPAPPERWQRRAGLAAAAVALAPWVGWTVFALRRGPLWVDTYWYHLPAAARFVQTGTIAHLQYFDAGAITPFYPFGSELLHAAGLLLLGNDLLSPVLDLGWALLALLAAWAIGRPHGRSPHALLAVAVVLGTPGLVDTQPGGAYNDVVCIALLLCAAAILLNCRAGVGTTTVAAVAAGLALGVKFTMVIPVGALALGAVIIAGRGRRAREAGVWAACLLVCGGYWYLRNLVLVGNPLPSLTVHLGPLSLPSPHADTPSFTVAQYLGDGSIWRDFFVPGLRRSLGLAWAPLLVLFWLGAGLGVLRGRGAPRRLLAAVALIAALGFLVSPQALGLPGAPVFFVYNVRYGAPALALGLALAATLELPRLPGGAGRWLAGAGLLLVTATELDPGVWPTGLQLTPFDQPVRGSVAVAALVGGALLLAGGQLAVSPAAARAGAALRRSLSARGPRAGLTAALLAGFALAAAGWGVERSYERTRFRHSTPLPAIFSWAQGLRPTRIGVAGFSIQYPLYGPAARSYVQYVGAPQRHRGYGPIRDCAQWRRAVNRGRYHWLVLAPSGFPLGRGVAREVAWTAGSPAAQVVLSERPQGAAYAPQTVTVLRIAGRLDPNACGRA